MDLDAYVLAHHAEWERLEALTRKRRLDGRESDEPLSEAESADEYLLMGLRLAEGIDLAKLEAIAGKVPRGKVIDSLGAQGLVRRQGERLTATPKGRLVLERLILELAA